ncbi:hypothetical protein [Acinetobacter gerneri]|jgi:hypothetical protein|uniref:hypothetical protein n=1 Tax=Acinetobacter gerneri TaxID=202952 RepID=UPI0023F54E04|nr:hypothetical protein [Acinetobacter gerneri]MCH4243727.1 hypothetical protein [Acinetobacter gerneri]
MKEYPLNIENWGEDCYMLVSKGHHDIDTFKAKCKEEYKYHAECLDVYKCPCEHLWYKTIPNKEYVSGYNVPVPEGTRGAFPVTVWWE